MNWKRISRHRAFQKRVNLLRAKTIGKIMWALWAQWAGRPPDRPGKVDSFHELIANFITSRQKKKKKNPAGRLALGDWGAIRGLLLEWASLTSLEFGSLLLMNRGFWQWLQRGSITFEGDLGSGLCFSGLDNKELAPVALRQDST